MSGPLLVAVYVVVALLPLLLAALEGRPPRPWRDEIATGLGLTAFAVLLVEFVLSGRFRTISGRVGMDVTMRLHQLLARTVFAFVLLHPFLYTVPIGPPRPWDATRQATLGLDAATITSGVLAWLLLGVLVVCAIGRDRLGWRYETWRLSHGLGAALVAALTTHHAVAAGRYSQGEALGWLWLALLALAVWTLLWVYLVKPLAQLRHPYEVSAVRKVALKTWELRLRPRHGKALAFDAGQFVWLNVGRSPFSLYENPFSIASAPTDRPEIAFVIKEVGDMTRRIGETAPGTTAYLDGPHGSLTLRHRAGRGIALIAGGVGIAPLLGILRELERSGDPRPVRLVYGNRVQEQIVHGDELEALVGRGRLELVHVLSEPPPGWTGAVGLVDAGLIAATFGFEGAREWLYFVCGPPGMMDTVEDALVALGVPARQIVSERFEYG